MSASELETVLCIVVRESDAAYLLQDRAGHGNQEWFPKSQVSFQRRNIKTGEAVAEIPLWLLTKTGWNQ